jgi:hypothetical protein
MTAYAQPRWRRLAGEGLGTTIVPLGQRERGSRTSERRRWARETWCTPVWACKGYTASMNRRFVAFLIMLAIGLQGPTLAYAAAVTANTMPAGCAGHTLGQNGHDDSSCCPQGSAPGLCCAGGIAFTGMPSALVIPLIIPVYRLPAASGFVAFATERPTPLLRPPIA